LKKKELPGKKIARFRLKIDDIFNKNVMLFAVNMELYDIFDEIIYYDNNVIADIFLIFNEKNNDENRFRKARTKNAYTILEKAVNKLKFQLYLNSYILNILFFSSQKEYYINNLFSYLGLGKCNTFVDVFFNTCKFYFFLNLKNSVIYIYNLPVYVFYRYIKKRFTEKVNFSINLLPYREEIKDKFEDYKKELNKVLQLLNSFEYDQIFGSIMGRMLLSSFMSATAD
jgi:hypothetical protein